MRRQLSDLLRHLSTSFWLVPSLCVGGAIGLSFVAEALDSALSAKAPSWYLFRGGPEAARAVMGAVASSMMTFTGLVFSVTILVLQLASSQFSPRVLRTFLKDRKSQFALGAFMGTFVYALLGLRNVQGTFGQSPDRLSSLTVWLAVVLVLLSVGVFIFYIHHVAQSIRVVVIISRIGHETLQSLERIYPEGVGQEVEEPRPLRPRGEPSLVIPRHGDSGVVVEVDEQRLMRCASEAGVVVALVPMVGDFVAHGSMLFEVWGSAEALNVKALEAAVSLDVERSLKQDTAFGLRQLVDIAERALSPSMNDPTTAVQAIDQIHDLLRRLLLRRFPSPARLDERGALRLVLPRPDWDSYVRLAVDEIRQYGEGSIQVARRLRFLLEDLLRVAPAFRRAELERQIGLLEASVRRGFAAPRDGRQASRPGPQGHGPP